MSIKLGLATAVAVTAVSGGAMAQTIGSISGFDSNGQPKLIITNMTSTLFSGLKLLAFMGPAGHGAFIGSTSIGVLQGAPVGTPSKQMSFTLAQGGAGTFSNPTLPKLASSDTFQLVGNGLQSAVFGDSPDWLGKTGTKHTSGATKLAALFAVPEPTTMLLLSAGVAGIGAVRRRRRG